MTLKLSDFWHRFQGELFPALAEEVGPLLGTHRRFVAALDLGGVEGFVGAPGGGSPFRGRRALARAFLAKAVWDLPTTRHLIDRLGVDPSRLCGWSRLRDIPSDVFAGVCGVLGFAPGGEDARSVGGRCARRSSAMCRGTPLPSRAGRPRSRRRPRGRRRRPASNVRRTAWTRCSTTFRRSATGGRRGTPAASWRLGRVTSSPSTRPMAAYRSAPSSPRPPCTTPRPPGHHDRGS